MKKTLLAMALLGAYGAAAMAQNSVTIYGSFDGGVRNLTNVNSAGNSRLTMGSTGTSMSNRIGFKGVEDLGGGMNAHFNLETGFNTGTGALDAANTLFNRTAIVGLGSQIGSLDFGRTYTVAFKTIAAYEPFNYRFPLLTYAVPASAGVRYNNDIQYTGTFGPATLRAEYALGEQAGSNRNGSAAALGANYFNGPISLGAAYTKRKPAVGTTFLDNRHYTAGGAYTMGNWRASIGYSDEKQETTTVDTRNKYAWLGVNFNVTPAVSLNGAYYENKNTTGGVDGKRRIFIFAGYYALSKRTALYGELDRSKFTGNAMLSPAQENQTGISLGINHLF